MTLNTPLTREDIDRLRAGDTVYVSGNIYCGRDAVLPRIVKAAEEGRLEELCIELEGAVIFHTAVSPAGVGPTSSNKLEIESSISPLSERGVRMHLGKGEISAETVQALKEHGSVFAIIPPVTALLEDKTLSRRLVAFPELGIEAFYELKVEEYPVIIAAACGKSIFA
ncbi:MAG: fumarate hydratase C-terminal domain-containing protein [Lachnospiraceae bacterium]|jgi:fumarate hydratase subunit beta